MASTLGKHKSNKLVAITNLTDAGTRGLSAGVLKASSWVRGINLLITKHFPFVLNTHVVDNINVRVVTKEKDHDYNSSLAASAIKLVMEQSIPLILFGKFSSFQKLLRVAAYMLPFMLSHESHLTVDGSITIPAEPELTPSVIANILFRESLLALKEVISLTTNSSNRVAACSNRLVWSYQATS